MSFQDKIQNLITHDEQEEALKQMLHFFTSFKDDFSVNSSIQSLGRLSEINKSFNNGLIPYAEYQIEKNRIRNSTIELYEIVKNKIPQKTGITSLFCSININKPTIFTDKVLEYEWCAGEITSKAKLKNCAFIFIRSTLNIEKLGQLSFENCYIKIENSEIMCDTPIEEIVIRNSTLIIRNCTFRGLNKLDIKNLDETSDQIIEIDKCTFDGVKTAIHIEHLPDTFVTITKTTIKDAGYIGLYTKIKNCVISNLSIVDSKIGVKCLLEKNDELSIEKLSVHNSQKAIEMTVYNGNTIATITNSTISNADVGIFTEIEKSLNGNKEDNKKGNYELLGQRIVMSKISFDNCKRDIEIENFNM